MRFSRRVFVAAGIWGLLVVFPLYFLEAKINQQQPPPITHPEYYYGFIGVTLAWQILYLAIARNPVKYRTIILIAILAKLSYGLAMYCCLRPAGANGDFSNKPARSRVGSALRDCSLEDACYRCVN
jgi:hypothetical protein